MQKQSTRWSLATMAVLSACGAGADQAPPLQLSLDRLMLSDLVGPLHLRVFPRGALRCDAASGQVRDAAGARVLAGLPGRDVTPAVRCGVGWSTQSGRYGTASPVDTCFTASQPTTVALNNPDTYIVLVHGQGDLRLPDGTTRSEILGSGCAEVTVAAGQQQSATVVVREQRPVGRCGDEVLDFDEACDLGAANMDGGACSSHCQTPVLRANTDAAGLQRHPAVVWPTGRRLVVAWQVENVPAEDVKARYFAADGTPETTFGALRNEVVLGGGASSQAAPVLTPVTTATLRGFAGAWETLQVTPGSVAAQVFNDDPPPGSGSLPPMGARRASPTVAASADRLLLAWREPGMGLRASTFSPVSRPLGAAGAPVSIADGEVSDPRAVALSDGTFAIVWSANGDIFARRLNAMGMPMAAASRVNPNPADTQDQPTAAALPEGGLVVAWRDAARDAADMDGTSVRWIRLDASLTAMGAASVANTTVAGGQSRPAVAIAPGSPSTLLMVWEDESTGAIRGRMRRADDRDAFARLGGTTADFLVSDGTPAQHSPAAAFGGPMGDRFVVAWEAGDGAGAGIALRQFPR
jgi:hypothetical protein